MQHSPHHGGLMNTHHYVSSIKASPIENRPSLLERRLIAAVASISLLLTGCSMETDPSAAPPSEVATSAGPTMSPRSTASNATPGATETNSTPSHTPSPPTHHHLKPRFSAYKAPDGSIQGMTARFEHVTKTQVNTMEDCGNETSKILLTFDDSGSKKNIKAIAKVLEQYNTGAIFFPNTDYVSASTINYLRQHGFWVGNHTGSHPIVAKRSKAEIKKAILSGGETTLFRPPYGGGYHKKNGYIYFDDTIRQVTEKLGMRVCLWTFDTNDWQEPSVEVLQNRIFTNLRESQVILMHMTDRSNSLEALPGIIKGIRKRGYELCAKPSELTTADIPESLPC
jgi:peptidoglycan/xylan/chitin deacetylase (PgdA/CDA1 family)